MKRQIICALCAMTISLISFAQTKVSGVVTDAGIFSPYDLHRYFASGNEGEYGQRDLCV